MKKSVELKKPSDSSFSSKMKRLLEREISTAEDSWCNLADARGALSLDAVEYRIIDGLLL